MSNFTPGPWHAQYDGPLSNHGFSILSSEGWSGNGWIACAQGTHVGPTDAAEIEANANLIAAAPDMYAVLRAMVNDDAFADLCAGIGEEPSWLKNARVALSKVEGDLQ